MVDVTVAPSTYVFGRFRLDPNRRVLTIEGETVPLRPLLFDVLLYFVENPLRVVGKDELLDTVWRERTVEESNVSQTVFWLRSALREYGGPEAERPIVTVRGQGYRFTEQVALEPAASVLALGPHDRAAPSSELQSRPAPGFAYTWRVRRPVVIMLATCAVIAATMALVLLPANSFLFPRVALAPFETTARDPLSSELAQDVPIEVAGALATSNARPLILDHAVPSGGWTPIIRRAGGALFLGGRIEHDGTSLRVNVNLTSVPDHALLWTESFTRPAVDAEGLKAQAALTTADVVHCALDAQKYQPGRFDAQTLSLFLKACDLSHHESSAAQVRDILRQVLVREPKFPRAMAMLAVEDARAARTLHPVGWTALPDDQARIARDEARRMAHQAIDLDPSGGTSYVALFDADADDPDLTKLFSILSTGIAHDPTLPALYSRMSTLMMSSGYVREALAFAQRRADLDPLSPMAALALADAMQWNGQIEGALRLYDKSARIWPDVPNIPISRLSYEARLGDPAKALALLATPDVKAALTNEGVREGLRRLAELRRSPTPGRTAAFVQDEVARFRRGEAPLGRAILDLGEVGAADAAFSLIDADPAKVQGDLMFRPETRAIRADPRFLRFTQGAGWMSFWRSRGKAPDFCLDANLHYRCPRFDKG